jgi:hypothetical protein
MAMWGDDKRVRITTIAVVIGLVPRVFAITATRNVLNVPSVSM